MPMAKYQEPKVEFTKVSFNVPKKLLEEFETIAFLNHYSRVEALKEAMRGFVAEQTPEEYTNADDMKNQWRQMMDAILEISEDPKYQRLGIDTNTMINKTLKAPPPDKTTLRKNKV
jgi:hypothetical protein